MMASQKHKKVIILGAGASGMMAAIQAASQKAEVILIEKNNIIGKKLSVTGNGKCNFTNINEINTAYRGENEGFEQNALSNFTSVDAIRFFSRLGIYSVNREGWLYPRSGQASSVADVLRMEAEHLGVRIKTSTSAIEAEKKDDVFLVRTDAWEYTGDALIIACGSKASSVPGSGEDGYRLAASFGHRIIRPLPALTGLVCSPVPGWSGVRINGKVVLLIDGLRVMEEEGEIQLTDYGISGIPVFQVSGPAIRAVSNKKKVELLVDFFPDFSAESLPAFLDERRKNCPYKDEKALLTGLFPDKLIRVLSKKPDLIPAIKAFPLKVTGGLSYANAQVCSGGVDTSEVDPSTMESALVKGLYFCGEVLDVDGACGGYNLQWAWSSGFAAGRSAAGKDQADQ